LLEKAGSWFRCGGHDVGSPELVRPCNGSADMEDLDRDAVAKVGLAGEPKEGAGLVKWGRDGSN
jgi:hypothetical protein